MAKTSAEDQTLKHDLKNSSARADAIREIDSELEAMNADIKSLQEKRTAYKNRRIKGELGMKMSDFNLAVRLVALEVVERNHTLDTIREVISALKPGEQASFLPAIGAEEVPPPGEKQRRTRTKKVKPEDLGETVNQPHEPLQSDEEFEAAAPDMPDAPAPDADETDDEAVSHPVGETAEEDFDPPDAVAAQ